MVILTFAEVKLCTKANQVASFRTVGLAVVFKPIKSAQARCRAGTPFLYQNSQSHF
jgi:hypothetical protein